MVHSSPPLSFPPPLTEHRTAFRSPGTTDPCELFRARLSDIDFCVFCGAATKRGGFRCKRCRFCCLDPDCHRSSPQHKLDFRSISPDSPRRIYAPGVIHASDLDGALVDDSGVEFVCACCYGGCPEYPDDGPAPFYLERHLHLDRRHGQRSSFVYAYLARKGAPPFYGMTYSPRTRREQHEERFQEKFSDRVDKLVWLSPPWPTRHLSYFFECLLKRLRALAHLDVHGSATAAELMEAFEDLNMLFHLRYCDCSSVDFCYDRGTRDASLRYKLSWTVPEGSVSLLDVYHHIYTGPKSPPLHARIVDPANGNSILADVQFELGANPRVLYTCIAVPLRLCLTGFQVDLLPRAQTGGGNVVSSVTAQPFQPPVPATEVVQPAPSSYAFSFRWPSVGLPPDWPLSAEHEVRGLSPDGSVLFTSGFLSDSSWACSTDSFPDPAIQFVLRTRFVPADSDPDGLPCTPLLQSSSLTLATLFGLFSEHLLGAYAGHVASIGRLVEQLHRRDRWSLAAEWARLGADLGDAESRAFLAKSCGPSRASRRLGLCYALLAALSGSCAAVRLLDQWQYVGHFSRTFRRLDGPGLVLPREPLSAPPFVPLAKQHW